MGFWWWPVDNRLWIHDSGVAPELARQLVVRVRVLLCPVGR